MKHKSLITIAFIFSMLLGGFTRSSAQDVQVGISLPYSGNFNYWTITFYEYSGPNSYVFETDDDTFDSQILGTLPPGKYNIELNSGYWWEGFDFGVCGPTFYHFKQGHPSFTWYSAEIEDGTYIQIDAGY
jgi:hypothetical protein